ncbi:ABC transporter permease [Kiloniella sp. b19]|uniref:ABC transporter permease n=1 Tax=Kiloniella sp. GXU_MW_B19 TaxID=3141326 RepID=UPI0031D3153F
MDFEIIFDSIPLYLEGLVVTLWLVGLSVLIGFALALPLSIMRTSKNQFINKPVWAFTYFFRGTPLLVQMFMIYYGLGQSETLQSLYDVAPILKQASLYALVAFTLNTAAYTTEIFRGSIEQTPFGEIEAAKACGMSRGLMLRRIILPSALRRAIPAYSNEIVFMLHGSAIASVITIIDLTGAARLVQSDYYAPFEAFVTAGAFYFVLTFFILWVFRVVEKRLNRHLRPREEVNMVV